MIPNKEYAGISFICMCQIEKHCLFCKCALYSVKHSKAIVILLKHYFKNYSALFKSLFCKVRINYSIYNL